ncbi:hypothetical protein [Nannocystis sp. SCPEA4]|uniref:hypothetical protein n=1 Tax=Nannocystis sp. SCPEA4 TaxID=2996787 RepID=UPI0022714C29|nr:hypothetical protein [Nannocystis sp. SCPEA4]MCY1059495.1 hypothetical protein [Nannocystis sp. SCPEA4]
MLEAVRDAGNVFVARRLAPGVPVRTRSPPRDQPASPPALGATGRPSDRRSPLAQIDDIPPIA